MVTSPEPPTQIKEHFIFSFKTVENPFLPHATNSALVLASRPHETAHNSKPPEVKWDYKKYIYIALYSTFGFPVIFNTRWI